MPNESELTRALAARRLARGGAVIIALVGAVALAGWTFGVPILATLVPGDVSMKANTALAFILAALALWQVTRDAGASRMPPAIGQAAAILVILIGGGALAEYVLGVDLGIDQLLVRSAPVAEFGREPSLRMAQGTALGLALSGTALLVQLRLPAFATAVVYALTSSVHLLAATAFVGYFYGVRSLTTFGATTAIALSTVVSFMLLSVATMLARPEQGFMPILLGLGAGGLVARTLLPAIFPVLFLLGWIPVIGERLGLFGARFGLAVMVVLGVVVATVILVRLAMALCRVDAERRGAQEELEALKAGLELKIRERTASLERALAQVKQLSRLIPICAWCKRIRDDHDYWQEVEGYIAARSNAEFTHGICPTCSETLLRKAEIEDG
ncbi:MAG: hypothetical protein AMXMBFR55_28060 [Gemmatimonadota bacterium]|jgi:hypothetical protein